MNDKELKQYYESEEFWEIIVKKVGEQKLSVLMKRFDYETEHDSRLEQVLDQVISETKIRTGEYVSFLLKKLVKELGIDLLGSMKKSDKKT